MTIEDLAVMVKKGFDQTVTKEEFQKEMDLVVTKEEFRKELGGIKNEIKGLKEQISSLAEDIARLKEEIHRDDPFVEDLLRRMRVVEKRMGIVK